MEVCKRGLARLPVQEAGEEEAVTFVPGPGFDRPYFCLLRAMAQQRLEWERLLREAEGVLSKKPEGNRP